MVLKITWSQKAIETYIANIEYLETEWSPAEANKFIEAVKRKIRILSIHPHTGRATGKHVGLRRTLINKRVLLLYRYKPLKKELQLTYFFNTHQKPK